MPVSRTSKHTETVSADTVALCHYRRDDEDVSVLYGTPLIDPGRTQEGLRHIAARHVARADPSTDSATRQRLALADVDAVLVVALIAGGQPCGFIEAHTTTSRPFSAATITRWRLLGCLIATIRDVLTAQRITPTDASQPPARAAS